MSAPTLLSPWYVVCYPFVDPPMYYTSYEESEKAFRDDPKRAMLFMSLHAAARVAEAEGAEVLVIYSKDQLKEFGR